MYFDGNLSLRQARVHTYKASCWYCFGLIGFQLWFTFNVNIRTSWYLCQHFVKSNWFELRTSTHRNKRHSIIQYAIDLYQCTQPVNLVHIRHDKDGPFHEHVSRTWFDIQSDSGDVLPLGRRKHQCPRHTIALARYEVITCFLLIVLGKTETSRNLRYVLGWWVFWKSTVLCQNLLKWYWKLKE